MFGGTNNVKKFDDLWIYDIENNSWKEIQLKVDALKPKVIYISLIMIFKG